MCAASQTFLLGDLYKKSEIMPFPIKIKADLYSLQCTNPKTLMCFTLSAILAWWDGGLLAWWEI